MSQQCAWLHAALLELPLLCWKRFESELEFSVLSKEGIYFFYELGEVQSHAVPEQRIVRIGTHRKTTTVESRMSDHLPEGNRLIAFDADKPKPSDRSIFRKNIGRVILYQDNDDYRSIWDKDFTLIKNRDEWGSFRNIEKEQELEHQITQIIRSRFSFRFIIVESAERRKELEKRLIGTVAECRGCGPSDGWLGNSSPIEKIRASGLWQVQHLNSDGIDARDKEDIKLAIQKTIDHLRQCGITHN